ncbi:MAG TPA: alpha/beta fold hydrolase [Acidimicrobiales bacterium]|nr:alpha/beta fold hydrolase [Acidimicrobiales bacterium]
MSVTSRQESPVIFEAAGEDLFGIFTRPLVSNGTAVLALWGAGGFPTFGKNQVRIRLARQLAENGFHVLRADYRGVGESGGESRDVDLSKPWIDDALGAVRWLESQGFERIAIVGNCFGSRTGLAAASSIPGLVGLALVAAPVSEADHREAILGHSLSWYLKRARSMRTLRLLVSGGLAKRVRSVLKAKVRRSVRPSKAADAPASGTASEQYLQPLEGVLARRIPVLLLYGRGDDFYPEFERAMDGPLGRMLDGAGDLVTLRVVDDRIGGMASIEAQNTFLETVTAWLDRVAGSSDHDVARDG